MEIWVQNVGVQSTRERTVRGKMRRVDKEATPGSRGGALSAPLGVTRGPLSLLLVREASGWPVLDREYSRFLTGQRQRAGKTNHVTTAIPPVRAAPSLAYEGSVQTATFKWKFLSPNDEESDVHEQVEVTCSSEVTSLRVNQDSSELGL